MPNSRAEITTLLARCIKCEQEHEYLTFRKMVKPIYGYFYWAKCPETSEPILMSMRANGGSESGMVMYYV